MEISLGQVDLLGGGFDLRLRHVNLHIYVLVSEAPVSHVVCSSRMSFVELRLEDVIDVLLHVVEGLLRPVSFYRFYTPGHLSFRLWLLVCHRKLSVKLTQRVLCHYSCSILMVIFNVFLVGDLGSRVDRMNFPHFNGRT